VSGNLWTWGVDYQHQPLLDAWWTPGWSAQNKDYVQVPVGTLTEPGFPSGLTYVTVTGNYFDTSGNPLSGYMTFWPSSALTFIVNGGTTYMPQRFSGTNQTLLGLNQMGDGKIYLWYGQLQVALLATDNANMSPVSFTYHVVEHYYKGRQYDIAVPSADSSVFTDINSLIIPGSICQASEEIPERDNQDRISIPVSSSQYLAADITTITAGMGWNPTSYPVNFAFISGPTQPASNQWITGQWANDQVPYVAQIMMGPNGYALSAGTYQIWVQVIGPGGQQPVMPVGWLMIY
jgi:hypothetical protein